MKYQRHLSSVGTGFARALSIVLALVVLCGNLLPSATPSALATEPAQNPNDSPAVGYATDADRTLIRWVWNRTDAQVTGFRVSRFDSAGQQTDVTVAPETDQTRGAELLDTWPAAPGEPSLYKRLMAELDSQGVGDIASLHAYLQANRFAALKLADAYYPLAQLIGWGYLDPNVTPGETYSYSVEALTKGGDSLLVGEVQLVAGQRTPIPAPTSLTALDLDAPSVDLLQSQSADWTAAQKNRRFDHRVYLKWNPVAVNQPGAPSFPAAWVMGYDIYRAPAGSNDFKHISGDKPVQPMPINIPQINGVPSAGYDQAAEQLMVDFYFADDPPGYGNWAYRVAARDLLGQPLAYSPGDPGFSAEAIGEARDLMPPSAPSDLNASVPQSNDKVILTWTMPQAGDAQTFHVERALGSPHNTDPNNGGWAEIGATPSSVMSLTDSDLMIGKVRWYRVRAVDTAGNRSYYAGPVQAVINDITPPQGQPQVRTKACDPADPAGNTCLEIATSANTDITRVRVYCQLTPGTELPMAELAVNGPVTFDLASIYQPPMALEDIPCRLRLVDAQGNLSGFWGPYFVDVPLLAALPKAPQPIITALDTAVGGDYGWKSIIRWDVNPRPALDKFEVIRENLVSGAKTIFTVGADAREYTDKTVKPGVSYGYVVRALLKAAAPYNGAKADSVQRTYKIVKEGQRGLTEVAWQTITWTSAAGTALAWQPDPDARYPFAVFRSVHRDADYIQLTPVIDGATQYVDASARHNRYWYAIVEFDPRTGEPVRFTRPNSVLFGLAPDGTSPPAPAVPPITQGGSMPNSNVAQPIYPSQPCAPTLMTNGQPLRFAGGFEVRVKQLIPNPDPKAISGSGRLTVTAVGQPFEIPVAFSNIKVGDASNHVCSGSINVDVTAALGQPIAVAPAGGVRYQVARIEVYPWFASSGKRPSGGDVLVELPDSLRYVSSLFFTERDALQLTIANGTQLWPDLTYKYQYDFGQANAASCGSQPMAFALETLPARVAPLGLMTVGATGISMQSSCMRYLDRHNTNYGQRPPVAQNGKADSNDGFLRGAYTGGAAIIGAGGLNGSFTTDDNMAWLASYPYAFLMKATGQIKVDLTKSHIAGGQLGAGSFELAYQQTVSGSTTSLVAGSFSNIPLDANGGGKTAVSPPQIVQWMLPQGFELPNGDWELYLAGVTTSGRPAMLDGGMPKAAMWETRPNDEVPVGLVLPAKLDPGLNRRQSNATLIWGNCAAADVTFNAQLDTYLRRGGMSQNQFAVLTSPMSLRLRGYNALLDNFKVSFLDNYVYDGDVTSNITLPFPAGIDIRVIDMWFNDAGCIAGGMVPASQANKTLEYWQIDTTVRAVEFRDRTPIWPDPADWDGWLWLIGRLQVPHLAPPQSGNPLSVGIPIDTAFFPDGRFYESEIVSERPEYKLDGFTYLLEELRLSQVGENPGWDQQATIAPAPGNVDWSQHGFVGLKGKLVLPYFGAQANTPEARVLGWGHYLGFTEPLQAVKQWTDYLPTAVTLGYTKLLYAQHATQPSGRLVGFAPVTFHDTNTGADMVQVDTAAIIAPLNLSVQAGQSSGVAALRAAAEMRYTDLSDAPNSLVLGAWAQKLGFGQDASAWYTSLATDVWPTFGGQGYADTSEVLDAYDAGEATDLPDTVGFGATAKGELGTNGYQILRARGAADFSPGTFDRQLEGLTLDNFTKVQDVGDSKPRYQASNLGLGIDRHGNFEMESPSVSGDLYEDSLTMNANLRINTEIPQFEGGFSMEPFTLGTVHVLNGSAVVGVGAQLNYIGASFDAVADSSPGGPSTAMGGSVLIGTIDPQSPILQAQYGELLSKLGEATSGTPSPTLKGFYLRVYGDVPVWSNGCVLQINVGAEVATWYFAASSGGSAYGGKLRGYLYGDILCIGSARGDLAMTLSVDIYGTKRFDGEFWIAAGVGDCDPQYWQSWSSRWWDDSWCITGGAHGTVMVDSDADWHIDYDVDVESPF